MMNVYAVRETMAPPIDLY